VHRKTTWRIGTMTNLSDQIAAVMVLVNDLSVLFPRGIILRTSVLNWMVPIGISGFVVTE
jgi:hypothetical protein